MQSSRAILKKVALTNFSKFTGKCLCQCLFFNKVVLIVFPCGFREIVRTPFLIEHLRWLHPNKQLLSLDTL